MIPMGPAEFQRRENHWRGSDDIRRQFDRQDKKRRHAGLIRRALKDITELGEGIEFDQMLALRRWVDGGVFEDPGVFVKEENGVEAGGESGVDVALGAVAYHPTCVWR